MGQIPAKYMTPSAPFGTSDAINSLNAAQPIAPNPQQPLLPPGFIDPGATIQGKQSQVSRPYGQLGGNQNQYRRYMDYR